MEFAREHWKIESMHWMLDVTFSEDSCLFLSENAHKTLNSLCKFALAVHKQFLSARHIKSSLKSSMLSALLQPDYFRDILQFLWDGRGSPPNWPCVPSFPRQLLELHGIRPHSLQLMPEWPHFSNAPPQVDRRPHRCTDTASPAKDGNSNSQYGRKFFIQFSIRCQRYFTDPQSIYDIFHPLDRDSNTVHLNERFLPNLTPVPSIRPWLLPHLPVQSSQTRFVDYFRMLCRNFILPEPCNPCLSFCSIYYTLSIFSSLSIQSMWTRSTQIEHCNKRITNSLSGED